MTDSDDRRQRLLALTLAALARDNFGVSSFDAATGLSRGAAGTSGNQAFVLVDDQPARGLGAALAWATRHEVDTVHLIASSATGLLARRATQFHTRVTVWHRDDRTLIEAVPEAFPEPRDVAPEHMAFESIIVEAGARASIEHGVLAGEVRGLEVCRAVTDQHTGVHRLEVGVGEHDREAFGMLHGDTPTAESLRRIVRVVDAHRSPGADPHPLNRLGAERALRDRVLADPSLIGVATLAAAPPPVPRANLKDSIPCVARGNHTDGRDVIAVFSTGIDLDVVPFAADARLAACGGDRPDTDLVIVVPERDASPVTQRLSERLVHPARIVGIRYP
ncbi:MAG: hypothetical protein B7C54_04665 [Acidimicrobiales bacterium mtb01]|nr:hypothetical protein [Actinomycetota bacterium]TEX46510.1 MAG: hypothetical protein B7C54_04665 [Acidimicrobiales bacterium mtb01]